MSRRLLKTFSAIVAFALVNSFYAEIVRPDGTPEHSLSKVAEPQETATLPAAEVNFREMRFRKPPLVDLYFDVTLRNEKRARWFLLPSNLGPGIPSMATKGGVDGVEVFNPRGKGRVVVGHFLGTGGFYALLLPSNAVLRLRMFPISFWGDPPDHVEIQVAIAGKLTLGGEDGSSWFRVDPTSSVRADITDEATNSMRMIRSRHTPDLKEVKTFIQEDQRLSVPVSLARK